VFTSISFYQHLALLVGPIVGSSGRDLPCRPLIDQSCIQ